MVFSFDYKVKPKNLWVLSMINTYRSMVGVVNIVFTASMVLLAVRFWSESGWPVRLLIAAGILFFPAVQPLIIYLRSKKIVSTMPEGMKILFDSKGMTVSAGEQKSQVGYSELKSVIRVSGMLILYLNSRQGFILDKENLAGKGGELFSFLKKKLKG